MKISNIKFPHPISAATIELDNSGDVDLFCRILEEAFESGAFNVGDKEKIREVHDLLHWDNLKQISDEQNKL